MTETETFEIPDYILRKQLTVLKYVKTLNDLAKCEVYSAEIDCKKDYRGGIADYSYILRKSSKFPVDKVHIKIRPSGIGSDQNPNFVRELKINDLLPYTHISGLKVEDDRCKRPFYGLDNKDLLKLHNKCQDTIDKLDTRWERFVKTNESKDNKLKWWKEEILEKFNHPEISLQKPEYSDEAVIKYLDKTPHPFTMRIRPTDKLKIQVCDIELIKYKEFTLEQVIEIFLFMYKISR